MFETSLFYDSSPFAIKDDKTGYLSRVVYYRELIYTVINSYLNPQSQSLEAQKFQAELENSTESLSSKLPDARLASTKNRSLLNINEHFEDEYNNADGTWAAGSRFVKQSLTARERLYEEKYYKSKVLEKFIDEIFINPNKYDLSFHTSPSINDKLWTKVILVHDFIYYGPVTILSIARLLNAYEDIGLNPLYSLLTDNISHNDITEIRVNDFKSIYYEAANKIHSFPLEFLDNNQLTTIIQRIISENNLLNNANISINSSSPIADFEHPCGYIRGSAVLPPAAEAPFMTLRIHPPEPYVLDDLLSFGMFSSEIKEFLIRVQQAGTSVAIAGTMGSGKTTLLSALAEHWPDKGRKATIEDTPELRPKISDLVKMRSIDYERNDLRKIDITRLTKACKRHSVRYVVLSEARDGSAWEILQLSQAILGSLMTFHYTLRSNRYLVDQALNTLVALCKQHPLAPEGNDIKHLVASMVQILLLVEQSPLDNIRRVIKIYYVNGFDEMNGGHFKATELFSYDPITGFTQSNICTEFEEYLKLKGVK